MSANRIAARCVIVFVAGATLWRMGMTENPVRDARVQGWHAAQDLLSSRGQTGVADPSDPIIQFSSSLAEMPTEQPTLQASVYVPGYSQIRIGGGRGRLDLATTLSIHNTSREEPIVIQRIAYHNTEGELVQVYLKKPVALKPLATIEVFVPGDDLRGGSGANFVIDWASASSINEPIIEAVMIGTIGTKSYSFVSQGRPLRTSAAYGGAESRSVFP